MRRLWSTALVGAFAIAALASQACDKPVEPLDDVTPVARVALAPAADTIAPDDESALTAALFDSSGNSLAHHRIVWSTSDESVVTVDSTGRIRGIATGEAVVSAIAGGSRGSASVVVRLRPDRLIVTPDTLGVGDAVTLHFSIVDSAGRTVSYATSIASENTNVLKAQLAATESRIVDVVATGVGTTNVVALVAGKQLKTSFVVTPARVVGIAAMQSSVIVPVGGTRQVIGLPYVTGGAMLDSALSWTSDDATIATIDAGGMATGHRVGQTTVHGRLQNSTVDVTVRVLQYPEMPKFVSVRAGSGSACALSESGRVYCWGAGSVGTTDALENGPGGVNMTAVPVPIATDVRFSALALGVSGQQCALAVGGAPWCWTTQPVAVQTTIAFASLAESDPALCGIALDHQTYCWSTDNVDGQLGTGSYAAAPSPTPVVGGHSFAIVGTGDTYPFNGNANTCAVTTDGALYCWGRAAVTVPDGTRTNVPLPDATDLSFRTIASGGFNCGITTTNQAYCWNLALGLGPPSAAREGTARLLPSHVFTQVTVGGQHACWLDAGGAAYCHGYGENGELGTGTTPSDWVSQPMPVAGGLHFKSIAAGDQFTCAVTLDGQLYCWGLNTNGRVGQASLSTNIGALGIENGVSCALIQCALPGVFATPQKVMGVP